LKLFLAFNSGLQSLKARMNAFKDIFNILEVTSVDFSKQSEGREV
jgi:hypothetical protein